MDKTKNDLSYNEATLDYQAMLTTSKVAYAHCLEEISRHLSELRKLPWEKKMLSYLSAQWLEREAKHLTIVAETMHTLEEGLTQETITITNKPEVAEATSNK